ncbi:3796_t:CDS:2 [Diversispora eburnea]|uniref:3796_t:CDS:1 n=1 Tax=Diversispora eburnea TaxID=1213867 RepID=A0A9N8VVU4_9GLOM|nr:3796_t:CDS:2 [Diversispora eburnea]
MKKVFESELDKNLDELSSLMEGQTGILCTNEKVETVLEDLKNFVKPDFARTNSIINQTIIIPRGVIKYGRLPSKINLKQKLMIQDDYVVCQNGDKLTENQAHLLQNLR